MRRSPRVHHGLMLAGLSLAAACSTATSGSTTAARAGVTTVVPFGEANFVQVIPRPGEQRVDVIVGGRPFTAYIWPTSLKKPVLFPIRTATGAVVTRGYPLEPRAGERVDHPHHAGLWFNYGDVNGIDFWNNSNAIASADAPRMGTILHRSIRGTTSGAGEGTLGVTTEWLDGSGAPLLRENVMFIFRAKQDLRTIDRITTLTALARAVSFTDNKEGLIGMRVARQLEQPSTTPERFTDATGRPTTVAVLDTTGVTGKYLSSDGKEGDAVWGTRGRWASLTGTISGERVRIAIFDHPQNPGYPTYWHARGYGLFAANPLGQKALSNGREELNFKLQPGQSVNFRHQILIMSGIVATQTIDPYFDGWAKD
ncbi:MAG: PmoA family protein [Gemmatimonadaceae bacterium]